MTIKKLAVLGTVIAGAALLQNRQRREWLMRSASDLLHSARGKLSQAKEATASANTQMPPMPAERNEGLFSDVLPPGGNASAGKRFY